MPVTAIVWAAAALTLAKLRQAAKVIFSDVTTNKTRALPPRSPISAVIRSHDEDVRLPHNISEKGQVPNKRRVWIFNYPRQSQFMKKPHELENCTDNFVGLSDLFTLGLREPAGLPPRLDL